MLGGGLGVLLVILFFQEQVGAGGEESMRRVLGGDHRDDMPILGRETTEHVEDLGSLIDGLSDVTQGIGELLQPADVGLDVHVTLEQAPKLSL